MIPLELPVRAGEAAVLADMILQLADKKTLNDELRQRIASRCAALKLEAMTPYYGSLQKDPSHQSAYFLAVDGIKREPLLLRFAPASSPASALFPQSILIGRMRPGTKELVVNAVPFGHDGGAIIRQYVDQVDPSLRPRPQGPQAAIAVSCSRPEIDVPAAFVAFREIQKKSGVDVASVVLMHGTGSASAFYEATLWAAIRAGWRDGYNLGIRMVIDGSEESIEEARNVVREAAGYTRFIVDISAAQEETSISEEDGAWCLNEFSRAFSTGDAEYELTSDEILQLAAKFHRGLMKAEQVYDYIRTVKSQNRWGRTFDFEIALNAATPLELLFCLHWLKARGRAAQLVAPNRTGIGQMAGVARFFNATLSLDGDADLEHIGRVGGRWNCTVTGPQRVMECWERLRAG